MVEGIAELWVFTVSILFRLLQKLTQCLRDRLGRLRRLLAKPDGRWNQPRMQHNIRGKRSFAKPALLICKTSQIRQLVVDLIAYGSKGTKCQVARLCQPCNRGRLHIDKISIPAGGQREFFIMADPMVRCHQGAISIVALKSLACPIVDNGSWPIT